MISLDVPHIHKQMNKWETKGKLSKTANLVHRHRDFFDFLTEKIGIAA